MLLPSIPGRNGPASVSASTHVESPSPALGDPAWASICSLAPPLSVFIALFCQRAGCPQTALHFQEKLEPILQYTHRTVRPWKFISPPCPD